MKKIIILASGGGTNAQAIMDHFSTGDQAEIMLVLSNNHRAEVLNRAQRAGVPAMSFNRHAFAKAGPIQPLLNQIKPDLIVLAGFLWKVPKFIIEDHPGRIINIHPALLPKYGGKGMYGSHVHEAVVAAGDTETGITIHHVNERYDEGSIIAQFSCAVDRKDTAEDVAQKIHRLEQQHFPKVIETLLNGQ